MRLLIIVLSQVDKLNDLLERFLEVQLSGATILNSTGMVTELARHIEDYPIVGPLRFLSNQTGEASKTILLAVHEENLEKAKAAVREVVGDLSLPNTAIILTLPIADYEGVSR